MEDIVLDETISNVRILATSRHERDIARCIHRILDNKCCLEINKGAVDVDIRSYVLVQLRTRTEFVDMAMSQELQSRIEEQVGKKANGMFRWAACQLDSLAICWSPGDVETALRSLPTDLNETYYRMVNNIPKSHMSDAIHLLQILVFSNRPLKLSQAVEIIATRIGDDGIRRFDPTHRLFNNSDILRYCPGLISISDSTSYLNGGQELHLAHFSVKEYLVRQELFDKMSLTITIVTTCLAYLKSIKCVAEKVEQEFPLARFAAMAWIESARSAKPTDDVAKETAKFFQTPAALKQWLLLHPIYSWHEDWIEKASNVSLYLACADGLTATAELLIADGFDINASDGVYGSPLQGAAIWGYLDTSRWLLDHGADVNSLGGLHHTAIQAASLHGNVEVVRLLLDRGADVNAQGGSLGNALQAALLHGNVEVVRLLLDRGAGINAQGGSIGDALQAASLHVSGVVIGRVKRSPNSAIRNR